MKKMQKVETLNKAEKFVKKAVEEIVRSGIIVPNRIHMRVYERVNAHLQLYQGVGEVYRKTPPEYDRAMNRFAPYDINA
jgi:hypothetical protein